MLNGLKIQTRIYAGFGIIVALGAALAGFGAFQLNDVGQHVGKMNALAGNLGRVLGAGQTLEAIRRAEVELRLTSDQAVLNDAQDQIEKTKALMTWAAGATLSEARRRVYNGLNASLSSHEDLLHQLSGFAATQAQARSALFTGGDSLTAETNKLLTLTAGTNGATDDAAAANVNAAVLSVRIANWRYLATADSKGPASFAEKMTKARSALTGLDGIANPDERAQITRVRSALDVYENAFLRYAQSWSKAIALDEEQLKPGISDMQARLDKVSTSLHDAFAAESMASKDVVSETTWLQEALAVFSVVLGICFAWLIGRSVVRPIGSMTTAMSRLATGDTSAEIPARERHDEVGEMARAVQVFRTQAIENRRLSAAGASERSAKDRRQKAMDEHTQDFGRSISGVMTSLTQAAAAMRESAVAVTDGAQRTRTATSTTVENAAGSARDLNSVAAATEQLAHSISEISSQVSRVTVSVKSAVDRATETDARVAGLSEAADRIGDVVRLITSVASQTNLLALNATIEAARAGDAGKGFAVVASEVKALATQTAGATDQIARQILAIREATNEAVIAVRDVGKAIGQVDVVASAIAAAVEQQSAATREITFSVQKVTESTNSAARAMEEVLDIAESTDARSISALQAAEEVGSTADNLRREVTDFLAAMSQGDEAERRQYERIPGASSKAILRIAGKPSLELQIRDISRGGASIAYNGPETPGTDMEIGLPGGTLVQGRIARIGGGTMGISFRQDQASLSQIDRALDVIRSLTIAHAA